MNTQTLILGVVAALALAFVVGGYLTREASLANPLPSVQFSLPFRPDEDTGGLDEEYISAQNTGTKPVDVSGWTLSNNAGATYKFPAGTVLAPGAVVTVYSGCARTPKEGLALYWCAERPVWHNQAGRATLRTAEGRVVAVNDYDATCMSCRPKRPGT